MKKITLLLLSFFLSAQFSYAGNFTPGQLFHHKYKIINNLSCPITITKIKKCWNAPITNPVGINPFVKVVPRSGITKTSKSGCFEYNPNFPVPAKSTDKGWDIDFLTKSSIEGTKVDSTFQYWYEIQGNCTVSYEKTSTSVSSILVGTLCGNNIAENNIPINGHTYTEQCDDGKDGNNDGCSDTCVLEPVEVKLEATNYNGKDSVTTTFTATKPNYSDYVVFQDGKGNTINNPTFPTQSITYSRKGSYGATVKIINNFGTPNNPGSRNPNAKIPDDDDSATIIVTGGGGPGPDSPIIKPPHNDPSGPSTTICGNGKVEVGEECDSINRTYCTSNCILVNTTTSIDIDPEPNDLEVVGGKQSITDSFRLKNTTTIPINFGNKLYCVKRVSQKTDKDTTFSGESIQTKTSDNLDQVKCGQIGVVGGRITSDALKSHTTGWEGRVNDFNNQEEYVDNVIVSWIDDGDQVLEPGEISSEKRIRVAAPTITNISSGSVFGELLNIGNVSKILEGLFDDARSINKNFVTVSIDNTKESYIDNITNDNTLISKAESLGKQDKSAVDAADDIETGSTSGTYFTSDMVKYKGHDNILVLDKGNLVINNLSNIKPHTTYIIEEGDLIINHDIEYAGDYSAFVVKKGNIRIPKGITDIKGIFITMIDNHGFFSYDQEYTRNKLIVDGALYGNVEDLVHYRTYIDYNLNNRQLDVGTVVNLTSEILQNPPPLLTKFLNDYIELRKVAR